MGVEIDSVRALFLILAAVAAFADWTAVAAERRDVEELVKPLVMVMLVAAAVSASDLGAGTRWLVACGLFFGLIGDVMLLPRFDAFLVGLAAFLVGHVLYLIGFALLGLEAVTAGIGLAVAAVLLPTAGLTVLRAVRGSRLALPVGVYIAVITAMVAVAIGTGEWLLGAGAVVFAISDTLLGHDRFVVPRDDRRVVVHVLYHLGQFGIVAAL